jgi:hypothetical protein
MAELTCEYSRKGDELDYSVMVVICSHSDYSIDVLTPDGNIHTDPDHILCTLSVADPGTPAYISDANSRRLVEMFMATSIFGSPPSHIMRSCKDFIKTIPNSGIFTPKDVVRFNACSGIITPPTPNYCNKTYDFFEEDNSTSGAIYLLCRHPRTGKVILAEPWKESIDEGKYSIGKRDILQGVSEALPGYKNVLLLDLNCSEFSKKRPLPTKIIEDLIAGHYAGGKYKSKRKKSKRKKSKNMKRK